MAANFSIAVTTRVNLPEALQALEPVAFTQPDRVDADVLITHPAEFHTWLRLNPLLPVLALEGSRLVGLGLLGARLVPHPDSGVRHVLELLEALRRTLALLLEEEPPHRPAWRLSPRERQVLEHLARGATLAGTGDALGIAETTVKNYLTNARLKLGERDRTAAILKAAEFGLIDWPPLDAQA